MKNRKVLYLKIIQCLLICIALFFTFYILMIFGSGHKIPAKTYIKGLFVLIILIFSFRYICYLRNKLRKVGAQKK